MWASQSQLIGQGCQLIGVDFLHFYRPLFLLREFTTAPRLFDPHLYYTPTSYPQAYFIKIPER